MNPQRVISEFGTRCTVDLDQKDFYMYCNKDRKIYWSAHVLNRDEDGIFNEYITYAENGTVDDIEMRCIAFQNQLIAAYFHYFDYWPEIKDKDKIVWNKLIQYVTDHQEDFFDKYGDWLPDLQISEDMIRKWIK